MIPRSEDQTGGSNRNTSLVFVLSDDFGEIGNVMYVLRGQEFASRTTLLLPPRLYAANKETLPGHLCEYHSLQDILDQVDAMRPDVVFLFSGYLYTVNGLLTLESVRELVDSLRKSGCRIVTSDPFLGALARPEDVPELTRAHASLGEIFQVLKETIHFYPVPCDHLACSRAVPRVSVFNPEFLRQNNARPRNPTRGLGERVAEDTSRPTWLFVLCATDYGVQVSLHGKGGFIDLLASKLGEALQAGRQPIFIGPPDCVEAVASRIPEAAGAVLLSYCSYELFTSLLLDAEYVFYWNIFSNSLCVRFANDLSAFFFDKGHLGRIGPIYELGVRNYFQGWEPVCLNQRESLLAPPVAIVDKVFQRELRRVGEHFRSAPSPERMIQHILSGGADSSEDQRLHAREQANRPTTGGIP